MIDFHAVFAPRARYFFLRGQEKVPKKEAARITCPANTAGFPPLLAHSGALLNSHDRYAPVLKQRALIPVMACGARLRHTGGEVKIKKNGGEFADV